ncbi:MAG: nucleotide exchange factor GrpE [Rikenellaceae bacterium]|nr:nucleotide exchange factor GrpE [Rikenellaceae bacterium]
MVKNKNKSKDAEYKEVMVEESNDCGCGNENIDENDSANMTEEAENTGDNQSDLSDDTSVWQDKYIRLSAEFDNFRKRTLKEKMELISSGGEDVIKAILPVMDDMDRAVDAVEKSDDIESARTGMKLIRQKLIDTLKSKGVCEIEALGHDMDTDLYEAVAKFPSEDKKGQIIDVVQKGYKLNDKVIRFSKVVVGE